MQTRDQEGEHGGNMRFAGICMLAALGAVSQAARADLPVSRAVLGQLEAESAAAGRWAAEAGRCRSATMHASWPGRGA